MKTKLFPSLLACAFAGIGLLAGCSTTPPRSAGGDGPPNGGKLWAQNCARCHNSRSPTEFSNVQWDVVLLHMRVRASLTAADTQAIREFLQTAN